MSEFVVDRHPWNRDFEWTGATPPFRVVSEAQAEQFDLDGFVVIPEVFDASTLAPIVEEIDRFEAETEDALRRLDGERISIAEAGAITFTTHLVKRSPALRAFATHPFFTGICADLIGPDVNLYWDQAVYKKPEKPRRFPWHQDNGYTFVEPQQYLTCWVALTDATPTNGCPHVAPGLHRLGTVVHHFVDPLGWECLSDPTGTVAAPVGAGGVVVFSSLTPHLTGPNTTDNVRKAYILQYALMGAQIMRGNPAAGEPQSVEGCDDPARQFPVVRGGQACAPTA